MLNGLAGVNQPRVINDAAVALGVAHPGAAMHRAQPANAD
jgi:hypothetical protein